jgi:hypothetical protein
MMRINIRVKKMIFDAPRAVVSRGAPTPVQHRELERNGVEPPPLN